MEGPAAALRGLPHPLFINGLFSDYYEKIRKFFKKVSQIFPCNFYLNGYNERVSKDASGETPFIYIPARGKTGKHGEIFTKSPVIRYGRKGER